MKLATKKSNLIALSAYVTVFLCGSYYLSSNHKNLIPGLILFGGAMTVGGVVLGLKK